MTDQLSQDLGRVEGTVNSIKDMLSALDDRLTKRDDKVDEKFAAQDRRIGKVEQKQWMLTGGGMVGVWLLARVDFTKVLALITSGGSH